MGSAAGASHRLRLALAQLKWRLGMSDVRIVKLQGPKEITSMSLDGKEFAVTDGVIEVPHKFAQILESHGFIPYASPPRSEVPTTPPPVMPAATRKITTKL
jgi:hypothetical protein